MENQTKEFPKNETHSQESEEENEKKQDAWIQNRNSQSGNSFEEEISRLKSLLDAESARFNEEQQRANRLDKELHDAKLQLQKWKEFSERNGHMGLNTSGDTSSAELLMEKEKNKVLQQEKNEASEQLKSYEEREKLLQRELDQFKALHEEVITKLQMDLISRTERLATLEEDLIREKRANSKTTVKLTFPWNLKGENKAQRTEPNQETAMQRTTSEESETLLRGELEQMTVLYDDLSTRYQTDVKFLKTHTISLEQELRNHRETHSEVVKMHRMLYTQQEAEKEALRQKLDSLQNAFKETETCHQRELEHIKEVHLEIVRKNATDAENLRGQVDALEQELKDERYAHAETDIRAIRDVKRLKAEKKMLLQETDELKKRISAGQVKFNEELEALRAEKENQIQRNRQLCDELNERVNKTSEPEEAEKKPFLKKVRHALGLRKPEKWKKNKPT